MKSCFFIGHRETSCDIFPALIRTVEHHIVNNSVSAFIVGNYGNFDHMAARAVSAAKVCHPEVMLTMLLPYHPAERRIQGAVTATP